PEKIIASTTIPTPVEDLQWLEVPDDPGALAWAMQRTTAAATRLQALPLYWMVKQELSQTLRSSPSQPQILPFGHRALVFWVSEEQPHGQLQTSRRDHNGVPGPWRTVLDVGQLRERTGIPYELGSWDLKSGCLPGSSRCLLRLSHAGGDEVELRE